MAWPRPVQRSIVLTVALFLVLICVAYVPRAYVDFRGVPGLGHLHQPETYGTDTIADMYEARVVLHDWRDMYTKRGVEQTALEARTWSKAASAPYPPVALLVEAGIYWLGERTGVGFYGLILALAAFFLVQVAIYCLRTRWYVFVLLAVPGIFFGYRFTYVQDSTYLIMLVAVMTALLSARRRPVVAHLLMAFAVAVKLSPVYYASNVFRMRRPVAFLFVAIIAAAFVLPYFIFENYLYIFTFQEDTKGGLGRTIGGLAASLPFAALLAYVSRRRNWDWEDRIGWGVVPVAMLLAFNLNVARHLLVVLLIPDKRALRSAAAAISVGMYYLSFGAMSINSTLPICAALLYGVLWYDVRQASDE